MALAWKNIATDGEHLDLQECGGFREGLQRRSRGVFLDILEMRLAGLVAGTPRTSLGTATSGPKHFLVDADSTVAIDLLAEYVVTMPRNRTPTPGQVNPVLEKVFDDILDDGERRRSALGGRQRRRPSAHSRDLSFTPRQRNNLSTPLVRKIRQVKAVQAPTSRMDFTWIPPRGGTNLPGRASR